MLSGYVAPSQPDCKWGLSALNSGALHFISGVACYNHDPEHRRRFVRSSVPLLLQGRPHT